MQISPSNANPFLGHRHARQGGLPEVLLEAFVPPPQDDTSHISDYTHQPKANSNADAPKKLRADVSNAVAKDVEKETPATEAPSGFQLEKLGVIASSIGSLFKAAPNIIQNIVRNRNQPLTRTADSDSENEITSDLTTTSTDIEEIESIEKSEEEKDKESTTTHAPKPMKTTHKPTSTTTTAPPAIPTIEPQEEGNIFSRLFTTVKSGLYLFKAVIFPPKHDPKAIEPPNTAFVTALENVMSFLQPLLGRGSSRNKRDVNENQERFYKLIERTVLERFKFDSDVQALQARIIFRESFVRYAEINLLSELTEERIRHLVDFFHNLNQYRNHTMNPNEEGSENNLSAQKSVNTDIDFEYFEKSASSESIFILFVEVLGTVAGLAWGTFSQFLWLISNMN